MDFSEDQGRAVAALAGQMGRVGIDIEAGHAQPREPDEDGDAAVMAVLGRAGSGKTLLLAHLAERLKAADRKSVV